MPQHVACDRISVKDCPVRLPEKFISALEQNQQLASCCRHPEDHDIEALYSSDADRDLGVPDIYIFHCSCGRRHVRFMCGGSKGFKVDHLGEFVPGPDGKPLPHEEKRPFWQVR